MRLLEARKTRRLLLELAPGDVVPEAFESALRTARARTAVVRGVGRIRDAELVLPDPDGGEGDEVVRRLAGPLVLVTLEAHHETRDGEGEGLEVHVLVARETDRGPDVLGGALVRAEVAAASRFEIEVLEDFDPLTVRDSGPASAATAVQADGAWAAVAEASKAADEIRESIRRPAPSPGRARRGAGKKAPTTPVAVRPDPLPSRRRADPDELLDEPFPERGDHIDHRQFGLCRVDGEDSQGGLIIRLPSGRRKTINLDFLEVLAPEQRPEGRVFPVRPRKKSG